MKLHLSAEAYNPHGYNSSLCVCVWSSSPALQHDNMTSASVEVVGAVCRRLTWSKYLYYLKHFVHILQTAQVEQKLAVK